MALPDQALVKGTMLAVNGIERAIRPLQEAVNQLAGNYQGLLVGKCDAFTRFDCGDCRFQPTVSYHGSYHGVNLRSCDGLSDSGATGSDLDTGVLERVPDVPIVLFIGNDDHLGSHKPRLGYQEVRTATSHEQPSVEKVGVFSNDVKRLLTNRSCAPQHCNISFLVHSFH